MKKIGLAACALALCGTLGSASAQTATEEAGSDTLFEFTTIALQLCGIPQSTLRYTGGGSGRGQAQMLADNQSIAPMSSYMNATACAFDNEGDGLDGDCKVVGLDGLSIYGNDNPDCANCAVSVATPTLRLIYFGDGAAGTWGQTGPCSDPDRVALAQSWAATVDGESGACADGNCQLYHAYRRDDLSGTTDSFRAALGIPARVDANADGRFEGNLFCNGTADDRRVEDLDPIRRTCENNDVVCSRFGTMGLVKPILHPEPAVPADAYPSCAPCTLGFFRLAPAHQVVLPNGTTQYQCPETGTASYPSLNAPRFAFSQGGFCYAPAINNGGTPNFNCTNTANNNGLYAASTQDDSRLYNTYTRRANGSLVSVSAPGMFYRNDACGAGNCEQASASDQIACLAEKDDCGVDATPTTPLVDTAARIIGCPVAGATPSQGSCPSVGRSIGFAGFGADSNVPQAIAIAVSSTIGGSAVCPNSTTISNFTYPYARRLYVCSAEGWDDAVTSGEKDQGLAQCLATNGPGGAGCNAGESVIACAARRAGYLQSPQIGQNLACPGPCTSNAQCVAPETCNVVTGACQ